MTVSAALSLTTSRRRRRTRLRSVAEPTLRETVKPKRTGPGSGRSRPCRMNAGADVFAPPAAARKSARCRIRSMAMSWTLGAQALAAAGATSGDDLAAADSRDARTETVAALTHQLAGLIGTLHGSSPLPGC